MGLAIRRPRERAQRGAIPTLSKRSIGIATTALAVLILVLVFHPPVLPWSRPLHMRLQASSFGNLNQSASVYLGGVRVGSVDRVDWVKGQPVLNVSIDPAYRSRVHRDASATIRPHGLLGPQYVDLDGGHEGDMPDNGTIPQSRVKVAVQLDEVLNSLQPDVRESLKTFLVELSKGSEGRGTDVNQAIHSLGQSHQQLQTTADTIQVRDQDLADFFVYSEQLNRDLQYAPIDRQIADTDGVLQSLVNVEDSFGSGIDETANTLHGLDIVMDGNQQNLAYVLSHLAPNMLRLRTAVAAGDRLVVGVNPALPSLMTAVMETKSAFSYSDADGHYVRIMPVNTVTGTPSGNVNGSNPPKGAAAPGSTSGSSSTDQQLIQALMSGGGGT